MGGRLGKSEPVTGFRLEGSSRFGVWHSDSHYWRKFIGGDTRDTDFNQGKLEDVL